MEERQNGAKNNGCEDMKTCVKEWKSKVSMGLHIQFAKDHKRKETRPGAWGQREEKDFAVSI